MGDRQIHRLNRHLHHALAKAGLPSEEIANALAANNGSVQGIDWIPENIKHVFKTSHDISPEWHVYMQAAFQKYVDNAITKTVNLPHSATPNDVQQIYQLAWELGSKGITIYRDQSRVGQAISFQKESSNDAEALSCSHCS